MASKKASKGSKAKAGKKTLGAKGPSAKDEQQLRAFRKEVAALAVSYGLAASAKGVNCRWEPRIRNGKIVYVWVCG